MTNNLADINQPPTWQKAQKLSSWLKTNLHRLELRRFLLEYENQPISELNLQERYNFHLTELSPESALRRLRQEHFALCIIRDIEHCVELGEIILAMSRFADFAINLAHNLAHSELQKRFGLVVNPQGEEQQLHIFGMGKLGGNELNVSSDIDLIFLFPDDSHESNGTKSLSAPEYFIRLGRRIIAILDATTEEGRVFRVDMRLRPHGDSGPLACSFDFFENYLYQDGRDWERYAWIKARLIVGDKNDELQKLIRPFVFRKYLDFSAVTAMSNLHQQIVQQVERKEMQGNIKLGRGGIREIEFIAQVWQLMRGGRRSDLQVQATCSTLDALVIAGFVKSSDVEILKSAYTFLRQVEHRIQYREDAQSQMLPTDVEQISNIADSLSMTLAEFSEKLEQTQKLVSAQFSQLFYENITPPTPSTQAQKNNNNINLHCINIQQIAKTLATSTVIDIETNIGNNFENSPQNYPQNSDKQLLQESLSALNLDDVVIDKLISHYKNTKIKNLKEISSKDHDDLIICLLKHCVELILNSHNSTNNINKNPDISLKLFNRFLDLLIVLARRPSYLKLLAQTPSAFARLCRFLQASSWGAEFLSLHPILLDDLLDPRLLEQNFNREQFAQQINIGINPNMDNGEKMNWLRENHHALIFRLLAQDLEGMLTVEKLADHLSDAADEILECALKQCWQQQLARAPQINIPQPKLAIIAYGKLGGKELGYVSDLDLVLISEDENFDNGLYYQKTAVSLTHWLNATTEAGILFETDYRLRPDGDDGVLVPTLNGFSEYQKKRAWVWEHQALTRARFCAGDKNIGTKFENLRSEILRQTRDTNKLKAEIVEMRAKMHSSHKNNSGLFDIKHDRGGLVDIEFIVQFNILAYSAQYPDLTKNKGNIALLVMLADFGLIPQTLAQTCSAGYREYRRIQHQCRLNGERYARVAIDSIQEYQVAVDELWRVVFIYHK